MTEIKKTPIPQRLKNVSSDHPYVAGAIDIVDDVDGRSQQVINADTYRKDETYSKEQLNYMITTPEQKYENYTAEDGDTFSDLGLPAEGEADTTYRVGSWDGTEYNASKFSEYSWDGTQYILLSVQSPGIDSKPTPGSSNLAPSGSIADAISPLNVEYAYLKTKTPVLDTQNGTLLIESGTRIVSRLLGNFVDTNTNVVFSWAEAKEAVGSNWQSFYLVLNTSTLEKKYFKTANNALLELDNNEVFIALVDFSTNRIIDGNFLHYYRDNDLIDLIPVEIENSGIFSTISPMAPEYANIKVKSPLFNTTNNTFTLPSGSRFVSRQLSDYIDIDSDVVFSKEEANTGLSNWNSHYLILNVNTLGKRYYRTRSGNLIKLEENEVIVALVDWSTGYVLGGSFSKYYRNGEAIDFIPKDVESSSIANVISSLEVEYPILKNGDIVFNYSDNTITFPQGLRIISREIASYKTLPNDIVFSKGEAGETTGYSTWNTFYLLLDTSTWTKRYIPTRSNSVVSLGENEYILALVDFSYKLFWKINVKRYVVGYIDDDDRNYVYVLPRVVDNDEEETSPRLYNPTCDLRKEGLKILDIGNSYTVDAQHYLDDIFEATGAQETGFSLYRYFRGSGSFKTDVNCYNDADNHEYTVSKVLGDTIPDISTGTGTANNGSKFRTLLTATKWDVIIIHQVSTYSTNYSAWNEHTAGGYLKELVQILKKTNPQATIGTLLIHSYRGSYSGNTEGSSLSRWKDIANAIKKFNRDYGIDFIIPYGTAVQNLRASSICDEYEFSSDGTHMADGIGDYVAGCCYYQTLFAPRTGISVLGNTFRKTDFDESVEGVKNINDENALLAQKAAMYATYNMYEINNPDNID